MNKEQIKSNENEMNELLAIAQDMRLDSLRMCHSCGTAHMGVLSCIDLLAYLYRYELNLIEANEGQIEWNRRDRLIFSKGYAGIGMYAGLKHAGCISQEMINGEMRGRILYYSAIPR